MRRALRNALRIAKEQAEKGANQQATSAKQKRNLPAGSRRDGCGQPNKRENKGVKDDDESDGGITSVVGGSACLVCGWNCSGREWGDITIRGEEAVMGGPNDGGGNSEGQERAWSGGRERCTP
jgi:hypothetical protein